jgi:uncharacterized damage-inducible protein DinB
MTASELMRFQLDKVGSQLEKCLEPHDDASLDAKASPHGMTTRQMVEHLCEAYEAFLAETEGRKWDWGSYAAADRSKEGLMRTFRETRARAVRAADSQDETTLRHAHEYLVAHDAYHVGQICLVNLAAKPEWDPYSIYS